jgi:aryl-alcohol dehydrogenase-like predicted oxidoreductase
VIAIKKPSSSSVSRLALGTAQFGLDYGVTNHGGRVSRDEVSKILGLARELGLEVLDTASAYGDAERILGEHGTDDFRLVTKLPPTPKGAAINESWVVDQAEESLSRLEKPILSALLIHAPEELRGPNGPNLIKGLIKARKSGITEKVGVSIYEPKDLDWISELLEFEVVQSPLSVFDRRLVTSGWLTQLKTRGIEVHVRSVFLQGSLLAGSKALPGYFLPWVDEFLHFEDWAKSQGLTLLEAALGFPLSVEGVDKIVIGVAGADQLNEVVHASTAHVASYPIFSLEDANLINPVNWPK